MNEITDLRIRIVLSDPPAGVRFALQRGKDERVGQVQSTGKDLAFECLIGVVDKEDGEVDFRGPFVQGPRGGRFVYIGSGTLAGDTASPITRRAKIALGGITRALVDQALANNGVLQTRIAGKNKDGGPACASVPLLDAWAPSTV
jgi:hypothetical protein